MIALKNGNVMQLLFNFIAGSTFLRFGTSVSVASLWLMAAESSAEINDREEEKNSTAPRYVRFPLLFLIVIFFAKRSFGAMMFWRKLSASAAASAFFVQRLMSVSSLLGTLIRVSLMVMKIDLHFVFFTSADDVLFV